MLTFISAHFPEVIDYVMDTTVLICLVFAVRTAVSKKAPAWWNYGIWMLLLIRMFIPAGFEKISGYMFSPDIAQKAFIELPAITVNIVEKAASANLHVCHILTVIWFLGAVLLGSYILAGNMRFWMMIKKQPLLTDKRFLDLLEKCKQRMNVHTVLGVIITDRVKSPALFGYLRPRLLLPEGTLEKLTDMELSYIFMHELCHLKRHDIGISWLLSIMQIIHWFNPLVWFAFYQMRVDQETACDASVLSRINPDQSADYGGTIIGFLEKFCKNQPLPALAGIMENRSQMKRRLTMIANFKRFSKKEIITGFALLVITGLVAVSISGFAGVKQEIIYLTPYNLYKTDNIFDVKDVDVPPRIIRSVLVEYPKEAIDQGVNRGMVVVRFIVGDDGYVLDPEIESAEPEGFYFEEAALDAVTEYIFKPAEKNGSPVACRVKLPVTFAVSVHSTNAIPAD